MNKLYKNTRFLKRAAAVSGLLYLVSQTVILMILRPLGESVMKFQLSFDAESIKAILNSWGTDGIEIFTRHFYLDFPHPLLYGSFLFFMMVLLHSMLRRDRPVGRIPVIFYLPFAATILDLIENVLELIIIGQGENLGEGLAFMNGVVSLSKWSLAGISMLIIAALGIRLFLSGKPAAS
jgi:hypothetical protein